MSFGGFDQGGNQSPMSEINTTPLVDVMLVLLIIFIITAPLLTRSVAIDLPSTAGAPEPPRAEAVTLSIDADGAMHWNEMPLAADALPARMAELAARSPQPELHLRADRDTRYQTLAELMSAARAAGVARIGFISLPTEPAAGAR